MTWALEIVFWIYAIDVLPVKLNGMDAPFTALMLQSGAFESSKREGYYL